MRKVMQGQIIFGRGHSFCSLDLYFFLNAVKNLYSERNDPIPINIKSLIFAIFGITFYLVLIFFGFIMFHIIPSKISEISGSSEIAIEK